MVARMALAELDIVFGEVEPTNQNKGESAYDRDRLYPQNKRASL